MEHWLSYLGGASGGVLEEFKAKKKKKHVVYGERYLLNVIHLDGRHLCYGSSINPSLAAIGIGKKQRK